MQKINQFYNVLIKISLLIYLFESSLLFCNANKTKLNYRLSNTTLPLHYDIKIKTELDRNDFEFSGIVNILLEVKTNTNEIQLHTKDADILSINLEQNGGAAQIKIKNYTVNEITDILNIEWDTILLANKLYNLKIEYNSELRDDNLGFYRSSYQFDGKTIWLAATQFAPTQARHAFPCYDEPRYKTTFQLELTHPNDRFAISNTKVESSKNLSDTLTVTKFTITPKMSTYLIGFVISDFAKIDESSFTERRIAHSAYVRRNAVSVSKFAAKYGAIVFTKLMSMLGGADTQPKEISEIKQIFLSDFHFSGMENWGIITYQEQKLFYDPHIHTSKHLLNILYLMGHEMSHQWFGNSMTHEWWTFVWLKEGFSTLYGYYGANNVYPEWNLMQKYQSDVLHYVFEVDADPTIRPMTYYVEKQPDILKNYDRIAYEKSSCVLRMFDNALGDKVFQKGIDIFLEDRKLKNSTENDLFKALEKAIKNSSNPTLDIIGKMSNWTHQSGYPLVTAEIKNKELILKQERFVSIEGFNLFNDSVWKIPINFEFSKPLSKEFKNTTAQFWMESQKLNINLDIKNFDSSKHWIILNVQQTGYYRVNYNKNNWYLIIKTLKENHKEIHVANRAQLIDDAFHLAEIGRLDYVILFDLLEYLSISDETEYTPWKAFENGMKDLWKRVSNLKDPKLLNLLANYIAKTVEKSLKTFSGYKLVNNTPFQNMTYATLLGLACKGNHSIFCRITEPQFTLPDLRKVYYCEKLRNANDSFIVFQELRNLIKLSKDFRPRRADYLEAIGCTQNENLLNTILLYTLQSEDKDLDLTKNERQLILQSVYSNTRVGLELTIKFIRNTWKKLQKTLCENCLDQNIVSISTHIHSFDDTMMFNELLGAVEIDTKQVNKASQNVINNLQWKALYSNQVENWVKHKNSKNDAVTLKNFSYLIFIISVVRYFAL